MIGAVKTLERYTLKFAEQQQYLYKYIIIYNNLDLHCSDD